MFKLHYVNFLIPLESSLNMPSALFFFSIASKTPTRQILVSKLLKEEPYILDHTEKQQIVYFTV